MCLAATSAVIGLRAWQGGGSRRRRTAVKQASSCGATTVEHQDEETLTYGKGGTLVVAGPSGVGKTTIINQMLADEELRDQIGYVVSHTTRPPREGEVDGKNYFFIDRAEMDGMVANGDFLEHAEVHGNLYGTSWAAIDAVRRAGRICVLDIDLQGVHSLQEGLETGQWNGCPPYFCMLTPENGLQTLSERLTERRTEDDETLQRRTNTARGELETYQAIRWDQVIVNSGINETLEKLRLAIARIAAEASKEALRATADSGPPVEAQKSVFEEFSGIARGLGSKGVDLGQGFPNFMPPDFVVQTLQDELAEGPAGRHQYTRTMGYPALVEVLAERYSGHLGRPIDPMREVAVTVGATNALFLSLQIALARSEVESPEVVVLEPFFELYRSQVDGLGAVLRTVPLKFNEREESYELDPKTLAAALGPQTAAMIVNTPHNPTGKVFTEGELESIAALLRQQRHIVAISDEVYKFMIFDPPSEVNAGPDRPVGHVHFANLPGMWERTITVSSAGKTFGITGWQIGWAIGPRCLLQPIQKFMPNLQFCAPTLTQRALTRVFEQAVEPYKGMPSYYEWLRADYSAKRDKMIAALESAGIRALKSQGGFFLCGDIAGLNEKTGILAKKWQEAMAAGKPRDWAFSLALAEEVGVVTLPVSPFFGPEVSEDERVRFVRFCFAKTDATLDEAAKRLRKLAA